LVFVTVCVLLLFSMSICSIDFVLDHLQYILKLLMSDVSCDNHILLRTYEKNF
jgi:hypothetical protein